MDSLTDQTAPRINPSHLRNKALNVCVHLVQPSQTLGQEMRRGSVDSKDSCETEAEKAPKTIHDRPRDRHGGHRQSWRTRKDTDNAQQGHVK